MGVVYSLLGSLFCEKVKDNKEEINQFIDVCQEALNDTIDVAQESLASL